MSLPLWKKYAIVSEVNRKNDKPMSMLAKELEILRTSLITILKNKENIIVNIALTKPKQKKISDCFVQMY